MNHEETVISKDINRFDTGPFQVPRHVFGSTGKYDTSTDDATES